MPSSSLVEVEVEVEVEVGAEVGVGFEIEVEVMLGLRLRFQVIFKLFLRLMGGWVWKMKLMLSQLSTIL